MRLRGKLCSKSRLIKKKKNADFHLYNVSCSTFLFFFAFLLLFFPFFFPQFRLKLKNPTSVSNEISTKRVLLPVSNFSDEPRNKILSLPPSLFLFYLFFSLSLPSFIPILVYLPSVTDRVRCQAELKSFHRVQMVLIFMLLPLLVSREISVQFILMRVLKSDWTDGERFALTKLCRLLNGDSYF